MVKTVSANQQTQHVFADLCELMKKDETLSDRMEAALEGTNQEVYEVCEELCQYLLTKASLSGALLPPWGNVDLVWHEFILHTQIYREFCQKHFGRFIDHRPTT